MSKWLTNKWVLMLLSLMGAVLLFSYVSSLNRHSQQSGSISIQTQETVTNVPVVANISEDQYVVTGLPSSVLVTLEGPTSYVRLAATNRNFTVETPNIDDLGVGEHTIQLVVNGLSTEVTGRITPNTVSINVERLVTKEFPVTIYDKNNQKLDEDYELDTDTVTVTGAQSSIDSIDEIRGTVDTSLNSESVQEVQLLAFNSDGQSVSATINPVQVTVTRDESAQLTSKEVSVKLEGQNENEDYRYSYSTDVDKITVIGTNKVLSDVSDITVVADVSGVTDGETINGSIRLPVGVTIDDNTEIPITVKMTRNQSSDDAKSTES